MLTLMERVTGKKLRVASGQQPTWSSTLQMTTGVILVEDADPVKH